jgi:hypothetical protein
MRTRATPAPAAEPDSTAQSLDQGSRPWIPHTAAPSSHRAGFELEFLKQGGRNDGWSREAPLLRLTEW